MQEDIRSYAATGGYVLSFYRKESKWLEKYYNQSNIYAILIQEFL